MGPSTHRADSMNGRPAGGKRWALSRVLAALIAGIGFPCILAFFVVQENQLAYASLAVVVGALSVLGTGYIAGESYRAHDYNKPGNDTDFGNRQRLVDTTSDVQIPPFRDRG